MNATQQIDPSRLFHVADLAYEIILTNGHGKRATPENKTRHTRFPHSSSLPEGERDRVSLREFHVKNLYTPTPRAPTVYGSWPGSSRLPSHP